MHSYDSWIGGRDVPGRRHVHTIAAGDVLADPFRALRLRRELDRGAHPDTTGVRVLGRVALAGPEDVEAATAAARAALPDWSSRDLEERLEFGNAVGAELHARRHEFVDLLVGEGHPRTLARWEISGFLSAMSRRSVDTVRGLMESSWTNGGRTVRLVRKADGVVGVVPPQNAAASTSLLGVGALTGGNTVVVKVPRSSPLATVWVWREVVAGVLEKFGAPPGTLNVICSAPQPVLTSWLDPDTGVDDVLFVGGSRRGLEIGRRTHDAGKKPVLELAGNDTLVVWTGADVPLAARAAAECFHGSAQICMVPKRVVVHPDVAEEFTAELLAVTRTLRPGDPDDEATVLSPVLDPTGFREVLDEALAAGAELLHGGRRLDVTGEPDELGVFLEPTIVRLQRRDGRVPALRAVDEETFFPLLPVVVWNTGPDEDATASALQFVEQNSYGLRNSLWTSDRDVVEAFTALRGGGILKVNDSHIGFAPHLPTHGGTGLTGGPFGEANYPVLRTTHLQAVSDASAVEPRSAVFDVDFDEPFDA